MDWVGGGAKWFHSRKLLKLCPGGTKKPPNNPPAESAQQIFASSSFYFFSSLPPIILLLFLLSSFILLLIIILLLSSLPHTLLLWSPTLLNYWLLGHNGLNTIKSVSPSVFVATWIRKTCFRLWKHFCPFWDSSQLFSGPLGLIYMLRPPFKWIFHLISPKIYIHVDFNILPSHLTEKE